ncbi:hypothetical protein [Nonomuraea wenchangensis]|uniref:hypothetical protein n=1 Tax=Nonomuraea wenchangensis TaxID=568860 RepID=UPI0033FA5BC7
MAGQFVGEGDGRSGNGCRRPRPTGTGAAERSSRPTATALMPGPTTASWSAGWTMSPGSSPR